MNGSLEEIRQEMEVIAEKAYGHYNQQQIEEALCLYRRAYDAAIIIEDHEKRIKYKQWEGHCLYHLGRFREALSVLISLSQTECVVPQEYLSGMIDQIDIAIKLPIELHKIRNLIHEAYNIMRQHSLQSSKSMILIEESILANMRYDYTLALDKAQEALACHDHGAKLRCDKLVYYRSIMDNLLSLDRINELKEWLVQLQELDTVRVISKELVLLGFQTEIAIIEGRYIEAYNLAKQRLSRELETDSDCFVSIRLVVRAGITAGKLNEIKNYFIKMLSLRHTKCRNWKYQIRLYLGDYSIALYQQERNKTQHSYKQLRKYWKLADKFYQQALCIGKVLDDLFDCDGRQKEISKRLAALMVNKME